MDLANKLKGEQSRQAKKQAEDLRKAAYKAAKDLSKVDTAQIVELLKETDTTPTDFESMVEVAHRRTEIRSSLTRLPSLRDELAKLTAEAEELEAAFAKQAEAHQQQMRPRYEVIHRRTSEIDTIANSERELGQPPTATMQEEYSKLNRLVSNLERQSQFPDYGERSRAMSLLPDARAELERLELEIRNW